MNEIQHKHERISNEKKQKDTMNNNYRINEYIGNYILLGHNNQGFV
jgi:hypothetical protein